MTATKNHTMFKINTFFFALLLTKAGASTLRTDRQLSEQLFLTYEPQTDVTDHVSFAYERRAYVN